MELRHLRYFVAVAEAENVSRAALKLHVSQPAVSRQIHDLEDELGFALLERTAKSVRLTDAGRVFLNEAREVLQRSETAVAKARAMANDGRGELHVGYAPSPTVRILPGTLRAFQGQRPKVRVRLHDLSTEEMIAGLCDGKLDISVLVRPTRKLLRGLRFEELARDAICLAVAPKHPLARHRSVTLAQIAREPLIVFNRKDYPDYQELLANVFAGTKSKLRIGEEHDSGTSLIAAVEAGAGVSITSESLACTAGPRLKVIPIAPPPTPLIIGAAWRATGLSPAAAKFLECAKQGSAKLPRLGNPAT
ncbi:MAG TPA: LysR family transcriptional regulator [Verrucomicrobiae bacterium]|nr:LysR family transcriptional regulator [Verrucomicrobiae bacterium]